MSLRRLSDWSSEDNKKSDTKAPETSLASNKITSVGTKTLDVFETPSDVLEISLSAFIPV